MMVDKDEKADKVASHAKGRDAQGTNGTQVVEGFKRDIRLAADRRAGLPAADHASVEDSQKMETVGRDKVGEGAGVGMKSAMAWTRERTMRLWHDTANATKPQALLDFIAEVQADALESAAEAVESTTGPHENWQHAVSIRMLKPQAETGEEKR